MTPAAADNTAAPRRPRVARARPAVLAALLRTRGPLGAAGAASAHVHVRLPGTRTLQKDFGFLDLMFLNLFVIGPSLYLSGAANIRGKTNKKD